MSKHYSREITMPKDKKEGLENFVQMIINALESGGTDPLLLAVDLLEDIRCGIYSAIGTGNMMSALHAELDAKHKAELIKVHENAFAAGQASAKAEIAKRLGLAA